MSVLSAQSIRQLVGMIDPFVPETKKHANGMSYGCSGASYDVRVRQDLWVKHHGGVYLASTLERFRMPNGVCGVVHDKSTWARKGLQVQNTFIDPGWVGYLTLELSFEGNYDLIIEAGQPIAQIVFHWLDEPVAPYSGKYQDQPNYAVGPR